VLLAVQPQNFLHGFNRHPLWAGLAQSSIKQSVVSILLPTLTTSPQLPIAHSNDLGRLQPGDLFVHCSEHNFLNVHRFLHCSFRAGLHSGTLADYLPSLVKADISSANGPDISCASDTPFCFPCNGQEKCATLSLLKRTLQVSLTGNGCCRGLPCVVRVIWNCTA